MSKNMKSKQKSLKNLDFELHPPELKSLYDVVNENLRRFGRNTHLHRLIYVGQHDFSSIVSTTSMKNAFDSVITRINANPKYQQLTGYLLYYDSYFSHVIEGSDESLQAHLEDLFTADNLQYLHRVKLLSAQFYILTRSVRDWTYLCVKPPTLLNPYTHEMNLETTINATSSCIKKLQRLGEFISERKESGVVCSLAAKFPKDTLPEKEILNFITLSPFGRDLQEYIDSFGKIPRLLFFHDLSAPPSSDGVPIHILDKDGGDTYHLFDVKQAENEIQDSGDNL